MPPVMHWSDDLSVGVGELDGHHRKMIRLINQLHDGTVTGLTDETLGRILSELADYSVYHFRTEETYMDQFRYPGYPAHRKEHEAFIAKVAAFQDDLKNRQAGRGVALIAFLQDWLSSHIRQTDQQYSELFRKKGLM